MIGFAQKEYDEYAKLMEMSEVAYKAGRMEDYDRLIAESNAAYENYEYAAGLKVVDEF